MLSTILITGSPAIAGPAVAQSGSLFEEALKAVAGHDMETLALAHREGGPRKDSAG
jgi:hypothetical protein